MLFRSRTARQAGRRLAATGPGLASVLSRWGYEPRPGPDGEIQLTNCPFGELARLHPALVCQLNLHLLHGLAAELGGCAAAGQHSAAGGCCVSISPR